MEVKPSEIEHVEQIGTLNGSPVRLLKTVGGFWICLGRPKSGTREEALAAGSHPAIVKYNVEKQFSEFQPSLAKSETVSSLEKVIGFTELLPLEMRNRGYEMYSLLNQNKIDYILTRYGSEVHSFSAKIETDGVHFQKTENLNKTSIKRKSISSPHWKQNSSEDIENEYNWEIKNRPYNRSLFPSFDHFKNAVENAEIKEITPQMDSQINNRSRCRSIQHLKNLTSTYQHPRDVDRIIQGIKTKTPMPHPIVVKKNGVERVISGNTRMDTFFLHGINPHVAYIDLDNPMSSTVKKSESNNLIQFSKAVTFAIAQQAKSLDKNFVEYKGKRFLIKNLLKKNV